ncbi:MAG: hypothetical protein WD208_02265 [Dehalococcoidia bacterium]
MDKNEGNGAGAGREGPDSGGQPNSGGEDRKNPLETTVSVLSALLIISAVSLLTWQGIRSPAPASFEVDTGEVRGRNGLYYLPLEVSNSGDKSAQNVGLRVRLEGAGVADTDLTIDWLPGRSRRSATSVFSVDPRLYEMSIEFTGYQAP